MQPDKKILIDILKRIGIIEDNETGKIIIHVNCGGITKITKPDKDWLK